MKIDVGGFFENTKERLVDEPTIELFRHYLSEVSKRSTQTKVIRLSAWGDI